MARLDNLPGNSFVADFKKARTEIEGLKSFTYMGSDSIVIHRITTANASDFHMNAVPAAYAFNVLFTPRNTVSLETGYAYFLGYTVSGSSSVEVTSYRFVQLNTNVQKWQITLVGSASATLPIDMKFYILATSAGTLSLEFPY